MNLLFTVLYVCTLSPDTTERFNCILVNLHDELDQMQLFRPSLFLYLIHKGHLQIFYADH